MAKLFPISFALSPLFLQFVELGVPCWCFVIHNQCLRCQILNTICMCMFSSFVCACVCDFLCIFNLDPNHAWKLGRGAWCRSTCCFSVVGGEKAYEKRDFASYVTRVNGTNVVNGVDTFCFLCDTCYKKQGHH